MVSIPVSESAIADAKKEDDVKETVGQRTKKRILQRHTRLVELESSSDDLGADSLSPPPSSPDALSSKSNINGSRRHYLHECAEVEGGYCHHHSGVHDQGMKNGLANGYHKGDGGSEASPRRHSRRRSTNSTLASPMRSGSAASRHSSASYHYHNSSRQHRLSPTHSHNAIHLQYSNGSDDHHRRVIVEEMTVVCERCSHPNSVNPGDSGMSIESRSRQNSSKGRGGSLATTGTETKSRSVSSSTSSEDSAVEKKSPTCSAKSRLSPLTSSYSSITPHEVATATAMHTSDLTAYGQRPSYYANGYYGKREENGNRRKTISFEGGLYPSVSSERSRSSQLQLADRNPISIVIPPLAVSTIARHHHPMMSDGVRAPYTPPPSMMMAGASELAANSMETPNGKRRQKSSQPTLYPRVVTPLSPHSSDGVLVSSLPPGPVKCKVIVLGNSGVGKTSIIYSHRYGPSVELAPFHPTIGANYVNYDMKSRQHEEIQLQIWDTAGMERFRCMVPMYMRNADAAILVYDITDKKSFVDIEQWLMEINRCSNEHEPLYVLVANKADMRDNRMVTEGEGITKAMRMNARFYELSAIDTQVIDSMFTDVAERIHERKVALREAEKIKEGWDNGEERDTLMGGNERVNGKRAFKQQCCAIL